MNKQLNILIYIINDPVDASGPHGTTLAPGGKCDTPEVPATEGLGRAVLAAEGSA
jgi:hypothetical protein